MPSAGVERGYDQILGTEGFDRSMYSEIDDEISKASKG
jgi:hypothetical protein